MTNPPPPSTPAPSGGGMPKWLIVLLVIFLFIILGCCGGFVACRWACAKAVSGAQGRLDAATQRAHDEMVAATQRAATQGFGIDTSGQGLPVPPTFPSDIPIYTGFKIMNSATPDANQGQITTHGKDTLDNIKNFYQSEMTKNSWKTAGSSSSPESFQFTFTKDNRTANIAGAGGANGEEVMVIIIYGKN